MIKQFIVRAHDDSSHHQIEAAVSSTIKALGAINPRVLVTQTHRSEWEVIVATDEDIVATIEVIEDVEVEEKIEVVDAVSWPSDALGPITVRTGEDPCLLDDLPVMIRKG